MKIMATTNNFFTTIFAKYDSADELRSLANEICGQVKSAFDARIIEITSSKGAPASTGNQTAQPEAKAAKAKTAKAKKQDESPKAKSDDSETLISITDVKAIKKLGLTFEKYNDKCWVLRGETKPLRKVLKDQFKGVFNSRLTGGDGWVFRTANAQECADALGIKVKVA